jgi:hypothetical protein
MKIFVSVIVGVCLVLAGYRFSKPVRTFIEKHVGPRPPKPPKN